MSHAPVQRRQHCSVTRHSQDSAETKQRHVRLYYHSTGEPSCLSSQHWGAQLPQFTVLGSAAVSVHSTGEPSCLSSQYWGAQLSQFTVLGSPAASVHSTGEPSCLSSQPVTGIFCCNTSHTVSWQVSKCLSAGRCLNTSLARIFCYSHDELIE